MGMGMYVRGGGHGDGSVATHGTPAENVKRGEARQWLKGLLC